MQAEQLRAFGIPGAILELTYRRWHSIIGKAQQDSVGVRRKLAPKCRHGQRRNLGRPISAIRKQCPAPCGSRGFLPSLDSSSFIPGVQRDEGRLWKAERYANLGVVVGGPQTQSRTPLIQSRDGAFGALLAVRACLRSGKDEAFTTLCKRVHRSWLSI